jgi:hexosaminidase
MRIRYQNLLAKGASEHDAKQFLLDDIEDRTRYSSIQYYHDNTINVCLPSALDFVDTVVSELQRLHQKAGQPLQRFHIGADETPGAWLVSPACGSLLNKGLDHHQIGAQFIVSVAQRLHKKGIAIAAWNDGLTAINPKELPAPIQVNAWTPLFWNGHVSAHQFANLGWPVVLSFPDISYFDFPYAAHPQERGYVWGSRANSEQRMFNFMPNNLPAMAEINRDRENHPYTADDRHLRDNNNRITQAPLKPRVKFAGMQAQLWSETTRTDRQVEYLLFPRLLHFAERAWHQAEWELPYDNQGKIYSAQTQYFDDKWRQQREQDWQNINALIGQQEFTKLARADIAYRVAPPGAMMREGKLLMNNIYPFDLQYRGADQSWQTWLAPTAVKLPIDVRAVSRDTKRPSRVQTLH